MKLGLMHKVVSTVQENWTSQLAEQIAAPWGFDNGSVKYFRGSANFIFVGKREGQTYILRFNHEDEREIAAIEAELKIVNYLAEQGLRVAKPVLSAEQRVVETIQTELGTFYAVVFEALPGGHWEFEALTLEQFESWGRELGRLHQALKQMPESYRQGRPSWSEQLAPLQQTHPEAAELLQWMETLDHSPQYAGVIHYDFELDNICWDGDSAGILDFDDCAVYRYEADIAFALRDLFEHGVDAQDSRLHAFLTGYTSLTELAPDAIAHLPKYLRAHELILQARLCRAVDIADDPMYPDWLRGLRVKLWKRVGGH
ncbi:phosphotransferase enzyme family protein [Tumebacillus avium]|nr:phosphotransferase [Tumebacillus avium]